MIYCLQDTIIALQALSKFLLLAPTYETSLTLTVTGPDVPKVFHINNESLLVLQRQQVNTFYKLIDDIQYTGI